MAGLYIEATSHEKTCKNTTTIKVENPEILAFLNGRENITQPIKIGIRKSSDTDESLIMFEELQGKEKIIDDVSTKIILKALSSFSNQDKSPPINPQNLISKEEIDKRKKQELITYILNEQQEETQLLYHPDQVHDHLMALESLENIQNRLASGESIQEVKENIEKEFQDLGNSIGDSFSGNDFIDHKIAEFAELEKQKLEALKSEKTTQDLKNFLAKVQEQIKNAKSTEEVDSPDQEINKSISDIDDKTKGLIICNQFLSELANNKSLQEFIERYTEMRTTLEGITEPAKGGASTLIEEITSSIKESGNFETLVTSFDPEFNFMNCDVNQGFLKTLVGDDNNKHNEILRKLDELLDKLGLDKNDDNIKNNIITGLLTDIIIQRLAEKSNNGFTFELQNGDNNTRVLTISVSKIDHWLSDEDIKLIKSRASSLNTEIDTIDKELATLRTKLNEIDSKINNDPKSITQDEYIAYFTEISNLQQKIQRFKSSKNKILSKPENKVIKSLNALITAHEKNTTFSVTTDNLNKKEAEQGKEETDNGNAADTNLSTELLQLTQKLQKIHLNSSKDLEASQDIERKKQGVNTEITRAQSIKVQTEMCTKIDSGFFPSDKDEGSSITINDAMHIVANAQAAHKQISKPISMEHYAYPLQGKGVKMKRAILKGFFTKSENIDGKAFQTLIAPTNVNDDNIISSISSFAKSTNLPKIMFLSKDENGKLKLTTIKTTKSGGDIVVTPETQEDLQIDQISEMLCAMKGAYLAVKDEDTFNDVTEKIKSNGLGKNIVESDFKIFEPQEIKKGFWKSLQDAAGYEDWLLLSPLEKTVRVLLSVASLGTSLLIVVGTSKIRSTMHGQNYPTTFSYRKIMETENDVLKEVCKSEKHKLHEEVVKKINEITPSLSDSIKESCSIINVILGRENWNKMDKTQKVFFVLLYCTLFFPITKLSQYTSKACTYMSKIPTIGPIFIIISKPFEWIVKSITNPGLALISKEAEITYTAAESMITHAQCRGKILEPLNGEIKSRVAKIVPQGVTLSSVTKTVEGFSKDQPTQSTPYKDMSATVRSLKAKRSTPTKFTPLADVERIKKNIINEVMNQDKSTSGNERTILKDHITNGIMKIVSSSSLCTLKSENSNEEKLQIVYNIIQKGIEFGLQTYQHNTSKQAPDSLKALLVQDDKATNPISQIINEQDAIQICGYIEKEVMLTPEIKQGIRSFIGHDASDQQCQEELDRIIAKKAVGNIEEGPSPSQLINPSTNPTGSMPHAQTSR